MERPSIFFMGVDGSMPSVKDMCSGSVFTGPNMNCVDEDGGVMSRGCALPKEEWSKSRLKPCGEDRLELGVKGS